ETPTMEGSLRRSGPSRCSSVEARAIAMPEAVLAEIRGPLQRPLLAGAAGDAFAQQISVSAVPGGFLGPLNEDVADARLLAPRREDHGTQLDLPVKPPVGGHNLRLPDGKGLLDHGRVGDCAIEVEVVVVRGPEQPRLLPVSPQ